MTSRGTVFVDTNVLIKAMTADWGAAKAVIILCALRLIQLATSEVVRRELEKWLEHRERHPTTGAEYRELVHRVRLQVSAAPSAADVAQATPRLWPVVRHEPDIAVIVSAIQARPDWLCSENDRHFNPEVARLTGLRIVTPAQLLAELVGRS